MKCPYCGKEYKSESYYEKHVASCDEKPAEVETNPVVPEDNAVDKNSPAYQK